MTTGLLCAMEAEVVALREALADRRDERVLGVLVHHGTLEGVRVALARSGVGKVNAALAVAALASLGVDEIVFTGVAGGTAPGIGIGDVVVASDLVQHDVDVTALGLPQGTLLDEPLAWPTDDALRDAAVHAAEASGRRVHTGRIASGDQFIASPDRVRALHETFGCLAAEMEGAAAAQVASKTGVPIVVIRTISDTADGEAHVDFPAFLAEAAPRGLALVRALLTARRSPR